MSDLQIDLLLWLWGIVIAIVFTVLLQDPLQFLIARSFKRLGIRSKRKLTGIWHINYHQRPPPPSEIPNDLMDITHFGNYFVGQTTINSARQFSVRAEILNNEYVTGNWNSAVANNTYHGVFQLRIEPSGNQLSGKWLGFTKDGRIRDGEWSWHLDGPQKSHTS